MNNRRDNRQGSQKAVYVILGILALAFLTQMPILEIMILAVLMALIAAVVIGISAALGAGSDARRDQRDVVGRIIKFVEGYAPASSSQRARDEAQAVADQAMERAGHVISESSLHLHDIGLLAYDDARSPKIYRTSDIPTDAAYLRPFVVLTQPEMPGASGNGVLRFSLIGGERKLRYTSRARYKLHPGQNFVTPPTWLPLAEQSLEGTWTLHVMVGDRPFGVIDFEWLQVGGAQRAQFNGDGEIDARTLRQLGGVRQAPLSLDELLADQGEVEIEGIAIQTGASRR